MADTIAELVEEFEKANLRAASYKEDWARTDYIEPLFGLLGWSRIRVASLSTKTTGFLRQTSQAVAGSLKEPDYGFYVDGRAVMYVEAKKPAVNIALDKASAYQLRRYSWNAGHDIGLLTNFRQFAIYNAKRQPELTDSTSVARIELLDDTEFVNQWDWLRDNFTPESIREGSLAELVDAAPIIKKSRPVDAAFLVDMETWRALLATDLYLKNPKLSTRSLNLAVQAIIDRLVFLRIAEARGLENPDTLEHVAKMPSGLYAELFRLFQDADGRYNSGLFHFRPEPSRSAPDMVTPKLKVGDQTIRQVIQRLVPSESPYDFRVLPVEILGHAYERFLGNVIEVNAGGEISITAKPEVKKSNGVYYTPRFVVEYIVKSTLNQLLQGKSVPEAERIRIVDPACGSGSFLLAAYDFLLDWHLARYQRNPRYRSRLESGVHGRPRLTTNARKRILLNNIFGLDLDPQAVEVAKLSLLLKVIEGETQLAFQVERLLPDLDNNIRRGNALIGPDYFNVTQTRITEELAYNVAPFAWPQGFPSIFEADPPGFDAVIGNPPYFSVDSTWGKNDPRREYLKATYAEVYNDKTDILFYFFKRALDISRGEVAFIVSRAFLEAFKADKLRGWLGANAVVREIVDFRNAQVFPGVGITTAVVRLSKSAQRTRAAVRQLVTRDLPAGLSADRLGDERLFRSVTIPQTRFGSNSWGFGDEDITKLITRIDATGAQLGSVLHVGQGMQTGANDVFGGLSAEELEEMGADSGTVFIRARNTDILRWTIRNSGEYILYLEDVKKFSDLPDGVRHYLQQNRTQLESRAAFQRGDCEWWQYTWPLHKKWFRHAKIYCPYLATENRFAIDDRRFLGLTDTTVLYDGGQQEDLRFIVGVLNSRLMTFRLWHNAKLKSNGIREYFDNNVGLLPLVRLSDRDPRHKQIVDLVQTVMNTARKLETSKVVEYREALRSEIESKEETIDALVFDLYSLDDHDIEIVHEVLSRG